MTLPVSVSPALCNPEYVNARARPVAPPIQIGRPPVAIPALNNAIPFMPSGVAISSLKPASPANACGIIVRSKSDSISPENDILNH